MIKRHRRKAAFALRGRGFLDSRDQQLETLTQFGDPLLRLNEEIDWEIFRSDLKTIYAEERRSQAGRRPIDPLLMFKITILQRLYNLSDDQTEYQIRDRASFQRFLGIEVEDGAPDAKTVWLFKERLKKLDLERKLFDRFEAFLREQGLEAKGGQIVDATIIDVPRQRNTRDENRCIKNGRTPEEWESAPHKLRQKDVDAEWTKKHNTAYFGYKNHTNVDAKHKFIRNYAMTGASVHDSQVFDELLDTNAEDRRVYADSAYRSEECEQRLKEAQWESLIHERAYRNRPLSEEQQALNREKSRIRARVEHVYGFFHTSMNRATFIRTIGQARARVVIGLSNLTYNLARFVQIRRPKLRTA